MTTFLCAATGREVTAKSDRLPRGWHRSPSGEILSAEGWKSRFVARSIVIPIVGPIDSSEWPQLRESLREQWGAVTRLSNWAIRRHSAADVLRDPGATKMPPKPSLYLYPESGTIAPELASGVRAQVLLNAEQRYRQDRYEIVWTGQKSLPSYRYPTPLPIRAQDYSVGFAATTEGGDKVPLFSARIGNRRWKLRIRQGPGFRRQVAVLRMIESGAAIAGAAYLYEKVSHENDNRSESMPKRRLFVRVSVHLPKESREAAPEPRLAMATTSAETLVSVQVQDSEREWKLHCSHAKRWIAEYLKKCQSLSDDTKHERRRPKRQMRDIAEQRKAWSNRHQHRMDSLCHEVSASLVNYAKRMKVTVLVLDDSDRRFSSSFPWHLWREKIKYKCDQAGIEFRLADSSGPVKRKTKGSLETTEDKG